MGILQKAPRGLLGLFNLKTLGKNPDQFGNGVSPVFESTDFYGQDLLDVQQATAAIPLQFSSVAIAVPGNETWRVIVVAAFFTPDAADIAVNVKGFLQVRLSAQSTGVPIGNFEQIATPTAGNYVFAVRLGLPLLLPPGALIEFVSLTPVTMAGTGYVTVLANRIPT